MVWERDASIESWMVGMTLIYDFGNDYMKIFLNGLTPGNYRISATVYLQASIS